MSELLRAMVKSVQDRPLNSFIFAFVVSPKVEPAGDDLGEPLRAQLTFGDDAAFDVFKNINSFDAVNVEVGDVILVGRAPNRRWVGIGKVV